MKIHLPICAMTLHKNKSPSRTLVSLFIVSVLALFVTVSVQGTGALHMEAVVKEIGVQATVKSTKVTRGAAGQTTSSSETQGSPAMAWGTNFGYAKIYCACQCRTGNGYTVELCPSSLDANGACPLSSYYRVEVTSDTDCGDVTDDNILCYGTRSDGAQTTGRFRSCSKVSEVLAP